MSPLLILDANNLMHRDFHACPTALGTEGKNVNAVRALARRVGDLRRRFAPAGISAVFDGGTSGREAMLPTYKQQRDGAPPELVYQLDLARRYLPSHFGCDTIRVQGFEADDVIAALVGPARAAGRPVIIVSNDKDFTPLVVDALPSVSLYSKVGGEWMLQGEQAIRARFGVPPSQFLDYLALCGDTSDGVPGIPGIGPKTAAILLRHAGTLEALLEHPELASRPHWRALVTKHQEAARTARRVLAPVAVPLEAIAAALQPGRDQKTIQYGVNP